MTSQEATWGVDQIAADLVDMTIPGSQVYGVERTPADTAIAVVTEAVKERLIYGDLRPFAVTHSRGDKLLGEHTFRLSGDRFLENVKTNPAFRTIDLRRLWRLEKGDALVSTASVSNGPALNHRRTLLDKEGDPKQIDSSLSHLGRVIFKGETKIAEGGSSTQCIFGNLSITEVETLETTDPSEIRLQITIKEPSTGDQSECILSLHFNEDDLLTQITPTVVGTKEQLESHFFTWKDLEDQEA